ncbi:polynucleotide 5'-hydroxyl-kinase [Theileria orientalis]|uniref:Polynucleotide 5'-hydroxyl-kinase n=1 Tax=Theileria orientalis TaxID=68886 RepID=A0A976M5U6_THEOR|nr:polynucleotide 5'-hydroxyl-kinase [Theileria orientalis]
MFQPIRTYNLAPFSELRVVTENFHSSIPILPSITLLNTSSSSSAVYEKGTAEIFGKELVPGVELQLGEGEKLAIFTWVGCSIQIKGVVQQEYEAPDNSMKEYLNVISALDAERESACLKNKQGPRVLVTGSPSSGKSSFCMILCNYAFRSGWTPVFVEADPRGSTDKRPIRFHPGTVGATVITDMDDVTPKNPLVYFYGYSYSNDNEWLYNHTMKALSASAELMLEENLRNQPQNRRTDEVNDIGKYIAASGMIINAPYQASKETITRLADIFKITMIIVIDSPSIHQDLIKYYSLSKNIMDPAATSYIANLAFNQPTNRTEQVEEPKSTGNKNGGRSEEKSEMLVLSSSKLEGVVAVDHNRLKYINYINWANYFEIGSLGKMHIIKFNMNQVNFVFIETIEPLSRDALPTDEEYVARHKELYCNAWSGDPLSLTNLVVAVPSTQDAKLVPYSNILGFFHVRSVEQYHEETREENLEPAYQLEVCCQTIYSPTSLPSHLVVPGDFKTMKFAQF